MIGHLVQLGVPMLAVLSRLRAKLLLVGDHRQLAAVGAAGGMELAADAADGLRHELTEAEVSVRAAAAATGSVSQQGRP